jgi:NAD(P)-dependent dehydrogenase (short-subunit alcohol dehydrogenase family)
MNGNGRLADKVAIITGAGSGIGREIALAYHAAGGSVVVADVSGGEKDTLDLLGSRAIAVNVDVSDAGGVERMIEAAMSEFGRIDVLCNNAGIDGALAPVEAADLDNFDRVVAVNLRGTFLGMRYARPVMLAAGEGAVVNISSIAGIVGLPGGAAYAASKAGIIQLTRTAAVECAGRGVRVNAICPGGIDTPMTEKIDPGIRKQAVAMTPIGRMGQPNEIAAAAVFLACGDSSYITGTTLIVDGGYTAL